MIIKLGVPNLQIGRRKDYGFPFFTGKIADLVVFGKAVDRIDIHPLFSGIFSQFFL